MDESRLEERKFSSLARVDEFLSGSLLPTLATFNYQDVSLQAQLADAYQPIGAQNDSVRVLLTDSPTYLHIRSLFRNLLDIETSKKWLKQGVKACLWGAYIVCPLVHHPGVSGGVIYLLGERGCVKLEKTA